MYRKKHFISIFVFSVIAILILGTLTLAFSEDRTEMPVSFTLQLLHAADMEGDIEALENAPRFSSVLHALRVEYENTVIIGAGDSYIPGPFFAAGNDRSLRDILGREGSGRADILILNAMGFMAAALGNHEFDTGTGTLAGLIRNDGRGYAGTAFPLLSANLDFSLDSNLAGLVVDAGQEANTIPNSITKSVVITTPSDDKIGVVGITTPWLGSLSKSGDVGIAPEDPDDIAALAAIVQESVDALTATGIDKVIVTGHLQQIHLDEMIASQLRDVDIIISGGSNTLLADDTDRLREGDIADRPYPILTNSMTNEPIAIVGTDGNYRYVGRLVVGFDEAGLLLPESIDVEVSGALAADDQGVVDTGNVMPSARVVEITEAIRNVVIAKDGNIFGQTSVYLNGNRGVVRTEETNLGNLTADANLDAARRFDPTVVVSLKNAGGIRASIGITAGGNTLPPPENPLVGKVVGEISQIDIENTVRFNNGLSLLTLTVVQLLEIIEHGVARSEPGSTPGQFPQVAGVAFSFDISQPMGSRVRSLVLTNTDGHTTDIIAEKGEVVGDKDRTFRIVTLDFLADGGDNYPYPTFPDTDRVDLSTMMTEEQSGGKATFSAPGREQDALGEYLAANFSATPFAAADVGPEEDERIQNLAFRTDSLIVTPPTMSAFNMQLRAGLNMISLPLMSDVPYTARSFMEKFGATVVIEFDPSVSSFIGFTANSSGDGFAIEGGKGYIINVARSKVVRFTGRAWENSRRTTPAAPTAPQISQVWALVFHAQLEGIDGVTLTVHNRRTGVSEIVDVDESHAVWADVNRRTVASIGDTLTIEVRDASGELIHILPHKIDARDIRRAFTELILTPENLKPRRTSLFTNYPNPFNPETWIPYQLANDTHAAIRIFSQTGELVRSLELGFQQAGYYVGKARAVYWDGRNGSGERLTSGVYFYQLITPRSTSIRKMVILK
ncbi:hypothetical protein F4X33_12375 [Candidatus Poribacteria bacterium]|nr:hypothetical protein [Candidatus Poribacteria bacterium]